MRKAIYEYEDQKGFSGQIADCETNQVEAAFTGYTRSIEVYRWFKEHGFTMDQVTYLRPQRTLSAEYL